jgi:hypothetical protein
VFVSPETAGNLADAIIRGRAGDIAGAESLSCQPVGRFTRVVLWCVLAVVVVAGVWWAGVGVYRHYVYGSVFTESHLTVTVDRGERFSLRVPDRGASVGDAWSAHADPADVVSAKGKHIRPRSPLDRLGAPRLGGGQGTDYFLYDAKAKGTTKVTLTNCFQGCDHPSNQAESRTVTWTITVR